jgi:hypothetical protein
VGCSIGSREVPGERKSVKIDDDDDGDKFYICDFDPATELAV